MEKETPSGSRRNFLKSVIPASAMICVGCPTALSLDIERGMNQEHDFDTKIKNEFSISWERYFKNRFNGTISWMKTFAEHFGKDDVINIIKEQTDKWNLEGEPNLEAKSAKDFIRPIEESELYKNCLDYEYVELTDKVCQIKVNKCLWAKTFRDKDAGDFGYACICHGDFSGAKAFNPKLKMERTKTLMQGHDCCNHRYIWEG